LFIVLFRSKVKDNIVRNLNPDLEGIEKSNLDEGKRAESPKVRVSSPSKRYTPLGVQNYDMSPKKRSILKSGSQPDFDRTRSENKKVRYADSEFKSPSGFLPDQSKSRRGLDTNFDVNIPEKTQEHEKSSKSPEKEESDNLSPRDLNDQYRESQEEFSHAREEWALSKSYYLSDGTLYFTNGPFYKDEMHSRVEFHHMETVRSPEKEKFVKPYLNKTHGSYYTGKGKQRAYYDPK
jgi:hypothetical protein